MAGYQHGKTAKKADPQYTPEQLARIQIIKEITNEALTLRERAVQAERRLQERRLQEILDIESQVTRTEQAFYEAKDLLRKIQREHPQPPGIGMQRAARFHREENAYKAEKATRSMVGGSYGIAA